MHLTGNVISMDLHLNSTGRMPLTGNVISMDLHPIRRVELGGNSLRLHCMPAWSNLVDIISMDLHPIQPVEFDWALITGQIG